MANKWQSLADAMRRGHELIPGVAYGKLFDFDEDGNVCAACALGKVLIGFNPAYAEIKKGERFSGSEAVELAQNVAGINLKEDAIDGWDEDDDGYCPAWQTIIYIHEDDKLSIEEHAEFWEKL